MSDDRSTAVGRGRRFDLLRLRTWVLLLVAALVIYSIVRLVLFALQFGWDVQFGGAHV